MKESSHQDYVSGGERRELLELALLETLDKVGTEATHKVIQKEFNLRVEHVKERLVEREKEITGEWLTKERMATKLKYSKILAHDWDCIIFCQYWLTFFVTTRNQSRIHKTNLRTMHVFPHFKPFPPLREQINQVCAYCEKFPSVLTRPGLLPKLFRCQAKSFQDLPQNSCMDMCGKR